MKWYHKAANAGIPLAQYRLGLAYTTGDGVERDPVEAHKWPMFSSDAGDLEAMRRLREVARLLSDRQLDAARVAADKWNKKHFAAQEAE